MKKVTEQWLLAAEDDLRVIARIVSDESLTHMVAFHCQQCMEKSLKAIIEEQALGLVRIHNLGRLFEIVKSHHVFDVDASIVDVLDKLYIDARYPADMGLLPDGKPTTSDADIFYSTAQSVFYHTQRYLYAQP